LVKHYRLVRLLYPALPALHPSLPVLFAAVHADAVCFCSQDGMVLHLPKRYQVLHSPKRYQSEFVYFLFDAVQLEFESA
jgi:hypothetical protein